MINYEFDASPNMKTKINEHNNMILFTDGEFTFIVNLKENRQTQLMMNHFNKKTVRYFYMDPKDGLVCFCHDDYDDTVSVFLATNKLFKIELPLSIEPGSLEILDVQSIVLESDKKIEKRFALVGLESDQYIYQSFVWNVDKVGPDPYRGLIERLESPPRKVKDKMFRQSTMAAFCLNWPYFAYSGLSNNLMILNAHDMDQIHRV